MRASVSIVSQCREEQPLADDAYPQLIEFAFGYKYARCMERGRKLRATSRPPSELTASANAGHGAGSSEDEDYEASVSSQDTGANSFTLFWPVCSGTSLLLVGTQRTSASTCLHQTAAES